MVRVFLRDSWWELRLKGSWFGGQRAAYEKIASGAAPGELFFYGVPTDDTYPGNSRPERNPNAHSKIKCRLVAWLPREQMADAKRPQDPLPVRASQIDLRHLDEELDIRDLREAIRATRSLSHLRFQRLQNMTGPNWNASLPNFTTCWDGTAPTSARGTD